MLTRLKRKAKERKEDALLCVCLGAFSWKVMRGVIWPSALTGTFGLLLEREREPGGLQRSRGSLPMIMNIPLFPPR